MAGLDSLEVDVGLSLLLLLLVLEKLTGLPPKENPPELVGSLGAPGMLRVASAFFLSSSDDVMIGLPPNEKPPLGSEKKGGLTVDLESEADLEPVTTISSSSSSSSSSLPSSSSSSSLSP